MIPGVNGTQCKCLIVLPLDQRMTKNENTQDAKDDTTDIVTFNVMKFCTWAEAADACDALKRQHGAKARSICSGVKSVPAPEDQPHAFKIVC